MKDIAIMEASITLNSLSTSLRVSIEEIERKNPHRKDLIDSMQKHWEFLQDARTTFKILIDENRQYQTVIFDQQKQIMELSFKLKQASKANDNLIQGI